MTEFNLSEKINHREIDTGVWGAVDNSDTLEVENVKEFIRLLKETEQSDLKKIILIPNYCNEETHMEYAKRYADIVLRLFKQEIEKKAGEKLKC